jgi:uncharacterized protein (TIGR03437 family)
MKQLIRSVALVALAFSQLRSQPQITAVVSSASFQQALPSGGGLATLFCSGRVAANPGIYVPSTSSPLPTELAGFQVNINGANAPILAVAVTASSGAKYAQINFQVPMERNVSLPNSGAFAGFLTACGAETLQPLPPRPLGTFFADANGYTIAQHASDYSLVTPQNPAHPGETIIAYADDLFPVWPPPTIGLPTPAQPLFQRTIGLFDPGYLYLQFYPSPDLNGNTHPGTLPLQTTFTGMAPGMIGVQQVNFVIPANQQPGTFSLFFNNGCPPGYVGTDGCARFPTSSWPVLLPVG